MPGIFKKLNASDVKITPFEAHKQYDTVDLASIGASTASLAWSGVNKSEFSTGSRQYYQLDKLYYRNYIQERAHRLELDDATYTTQERRLYQSASLLSLSQKTFGSEVQPNSFELSGSKSELQFYFKDDGFGNLYDVDLGKDNFPNEDNRVFYLAPVNAFKRADLTLDFETGNNYVNSPFFNGFSGDYYDNSYFLNPLTYTNVEFAESSPFSFIIGQAIIGTSIIQETNRNNFYGIKSVKTDTQFIIGSAVIGTSAITNGNETPLTDSLIKIDHQPYLNFNHDEDFTINFFYDVTDQDILNADLGQTDVITFFSTAPLNRSPILTSSIEHNDKTGGRRVLITNNSGDEFYLAFSGSGYEAPTDETGSATLVKIDLINQDSDGNGSINSLSASLAFTASLSSVTDIVFNPSNSTLASGIVAFGVSTDPLVATSFSTDVSSSFPSATASLSTITIATSSTDYYIISKEGTKTAAILPSETTQWTSLSTTGSSQIGTAPVGSQFPYRIFYRVGESPNSSSIHFERSDGETTQTVSCSFFGGINSGNIARRQISAQNIISSGRDLRLRIRPNDTTYHSSTTQGSPTLTKHCTNQADITLFAQPNPDGTYSNRLNNGAGQVSQLMIWNVALTGTEQTNVYNSVTGTYPVGNIFYDNGFAVITHPKYMDVLDGGTLNTLKYKNTHLITENEYQCTMNENEFEFTRNISARKIPFDKNEDIANFATGSNFKPYITTIGLHDEDGNLLVVGKLAQPVRASSETNTTFVIRYDT